LGADPTRLYFQLRPFRAGLGFLHSHSDVVGGDETAVDAVRPQWTS
jgi:hypothetical protein